MHTKHKMMNKPPITKLSRGIFLVASPEMDEGIFSRSVIFICEHNMNGSFGLIINKHVGVSFSEEFLQLKDTDNNHLKVSAGGPVQTHQLMTLHNCKENAGQTLQITEDTFLGGDLPFIQNLIHDPEKTYQLCLCFGYSGWSPGQLENEILEGRWFLSPLHEDLIFSTDYQSIWRLCLKRMGGRYASLSMIPENLSLN